MLWPAQPNFTELNLVQVGGKLHDRLQPNMLQKLISFASSGARCQQVKNKTFYTEEVLQLH